MRESITMSDISRYFLYLCLFSFVLFLPVTKTADFDIFFHLRLGELTFENRALPLHDTLSYTAAGQRLYLGDWMSNLILYLTHRWGGWAGLTALKTALFLLTMLFIWKSGNAANMGGGTAALAFTIVLTALSMRFRLNLRPYYFSFLFLSLFLYTFMRYQKDRWKGVYLLPVFQTLWANTHGGGIVGPALTALFFLSEVIRNRGVDRRLGAALLLTALGAGLSPEGFGPYGILYSFIPGMGETTDSAFSISQIDEWAPMTTGMLWGYGLRYTFAFQALVAGSLVFIIAKALKRELTLFQVVLFIGSVLYPLRHVRMIDLSSIALAPFFYGGLLCLPEVLKRPGAVKAVIAGVFIIAIGWFSIFKSPIYAFGVGPKERIFPESAVRLLKEQNIQGRGFNTIPAGSYLLFADKGRKVFIDGRLSYPGEFITTYFHALKSPETFDALDKQYDFRYALAEYGSKPTWKFPFHLNENPGWALVMWDDAGALYLKRTPENEALIDRYGYLVLRPNFNRFSYLDERLGLGLALLHAIDHDIALNPANMGGGTAANMGGGPAALQEAYLAKAYAAYYLDMKETAFNALNAALGMPPDTAFEHLALAQLLIEAGQKEKARKELRRALRLEPFNAEAKTLLKGL